MTDPTRSSRGRFAPGNPGKPKGARHRASQAIQNLLEGEHERLARTVVERALEGDMAAMRLCLERLAPRMKDTPLTVALPPIRTAEETVAASAALLAAAAAGEITPDEAGRLMMLLVHHKTILETGDLEQRILALEEKEGS